MTIHATHPFPRLHIADKAPTREQVRAFVKLGRPIFLPNSGLLVILGVVLAVSDGRGINWRMAALALGFAWLTHLACHYANDYFDLEADRMNGARTGITGGSGVLTTRSLRPRTSLNASLALLLIDLGLVTLMPTASTRILALVTIVLMWCYTAPPVRFNYRGLGELCCALCMELLLPVITFQLQGGVAGWWLPMLLLPLVLAQTARMTVMNLADREPDQLVGKRTLAVILGARHARVFRTAQLVIYSLTGLSVTLGATPPLVGACVLMTAPLSWWVSRLIPAGATESGVMRRLVVLATNHVSSLVLATTIGLLGSIQFGAAGQGGSLLDCWAAVACYLVLFGAQTWAFARKARAAASPAAAMA